MRLQIEKFEIYSAEQNRVMTNIRLVKTFI